MMTLNNLALAILLQNTLSFAVGVLTPAPFGINGGFSAPSVLPVSSPNAGPVPVLNVPTQSVFQKAVPAPNVQVFPSTFPTVSTMSSGYTFRCRSYPQIVQDFASKFVQGMNATPNLKSIFDFGNANASHLAGLYRDRTISNHNSIKALDSDFSSQLVFDAITNNFHKATADSHIQMIGNFVAKYLYLRGLLNPNSVDTLSQEYIQKMQEGLQLASALSPAQPLSIESKLDAIFSGVRNFLTAHQLYTLDSVWAMSALFSNEWDI